MVSARVAVLTSVRSQGLLVIFIGTARVQPFLPCSFPTLLQSDEQLAAQSRELDASPGCIPPALQPICAALSGAVNSADCQVPIASSTLQFTPHVDPIISGRHFQ